MKQRYIGIDIDAETIKVAEIEAARSAESATSQTPAKRFHPPRTDALFRHSEHDGLQLLPKLSDFSLRVRRMPIRPFAVSDLQQTLEARSVGAECTPEELL